MLDRKTLIVYVIRTLVAWALLSFAISIYVLYTVLGNDSNNYAANYEYQSLYSIFVKIFIGGAVYLFRTINDAAVTITALATIAIGMFTYTLWKSTHKLWEEARSASKTAQDAAEAAKKQAELSTAEYIGSHIPRLIVRRVQLRCDST